MTQFGRSVRAIWHSTIRQWWFVLAGFRGAVSEGLKFLVSIVLTFTAGDAWSHAPSLPLFTPQVTLFDLLRPGDNPVQRFIIGSFGVISAYVLGWLLVGLMPARQRQRPAHARLMASMALVFVTVNLTALALAIFVFKYDWHTIGANNWVLLVFGSFTLSTYCVIGVITAMAGARATWRTGGRALAVSLLLVFVNLGLPQSWNIMVHIHTMESIPLWVRLIPLLFTTCVIEPVALFVYAAVAAGENLWTAIRKGVSFLGRHAWVALLIGAVLFISDPAVFGIDGMIMWWGRSVVSSFYRTIVIPLDKALPYIHAFLALCVCAVAAQHYADVTARKDPPAIV